jgi:hypothetical protein
MKAVYEYNGNETKYKTNGGVFIMIGGGYEQIYPLTKIED